jgi:hypothetical protein
MLLLVGEDIPLYETPSQRETTPGGNRMEAPAFFEQSSQVKREADAFLEETKLLFFLQSYSGKYSKLSIKQMSFTKRVVGAK